MPSKLMLSIIGLGLAGVIGYCVHFDKKRRMDPLYKQKVRERRVRKQQQALIDRAIPNNPQANDVKRYFVQQLQLGEAFINAGHHELGAEHLVNALSVCADGHHILQSIESFLPPRVYDLVLARLHENALMPQRMNRFNLTELDQPGNAGLDSLD